MDFFPKFFSSNWNYTSPNFRTIVFWRIFLAFFKFYKKSVVSFDNFLRNFQISRNKKKKRLASTLSYSNFHDLYKLKNEVLSQGSYGRFETCTNVFLGKDYAVKIIKKEAVFFNRKKMMKEIDLYHWCVNHKKI